MILLQYILQLLMIAGLILAAVHLYSMFSKLVKTFNSRRLAIEELRNLVPYTTPAKDEQLKFEYQNNKKALRIINNTPKAKAFSLYTAPEKPYYEEDNVVRMSRRKQVSEQLEFKRAVRSGVITSSDAKILNFTTTSNSPIPKEN